MGNEARFADLCVVVLCPRELELRHGWCESFGPEGETREGSCGLWDGYLHCDLRLEAESRIIHQ